MNDEFNLLQKVRHLSGYKVTITGLCLGRRALIDFWGDGTLVAWVSFDDLEAL